MNREIKFRGLTLDGKGWVYGNLVENHLATRIVEDFTLSSTDEHGLNYCGGCFQLVLPESVGQFTGLKDKNGVDIYEGDIVETDGSMIFSNYDSGKGSKREIFVTTSGYVGVRNQFDKVNNSSAHIWSNYQLWNINRSLQIIGNIHQNPELI